MINDKKVLGLIPARGGSKGIKKKNIVLLKGKPLIYYTIKSSLESIYLDKVAVSTDDKEIASISSDLGAEIIPRPIEFAQDNSSDYDVVRHAIDYTESNGEVFDLVVLLRPTSPFRKAEQIDMALRMINDYDSVRSVKKVVEHPYWMKTITEDGLLIPIIKGKDEKSYYQRQLLPEVYILSGFIDVVNRNIIINGKLYGDKVKAFLTEATVDIDDHEDLKKAEDGNWENA